MRRIADVIQSESLIFLFAIAASILLSIWNNARITIINPDAVCYFLSAQTIGTSGVHAAMQLCPQSKWPLYSFLLYSFVTITHLSYAFVAYTLNGIFTLISIVCFLLILQTMGATRRVLWLGAAVILLSHEFNVVREYIVRDHGYWAFSLISVLLLIKYFQKPNWTMAIAWNLALLLATLFRIEGAFFLLGVPFAAFFCTQYSFMQRVRNFLTLNVLTILSLFTIMAWLILHPEQTIAKLGRLSEVVQQVQAGLALIVYRYESMRIAFIAYVLNPDAARDAGMVLIMAWISWYVICVLKTLSVIYTLLVAYAWRQKCVSAPAVTMIVLFSYILVNFLVTFVFLLESEFLSKRYLMELALLLMLWVPFALDALIESWRVHRYRLATTGVVLAIFITSLGGFVSFGTSKSHIRAAGEWLATNVPANASLYVNDYQLMYYSQHFGNSIFEKFRTYRNINSIAQNKWKQFDYLALRVHSHAGVMTPILSEMTQPPLQVFKNKQGDQVAIYKISKKENAL